jgi:hypothetical protein
MMALSLKSQSAHIGNQLSIRPLLNEAEVKGTISSVPGYLGRTADLPDVIVTIWWNMRQSWTHNGQLWLNCFGHDGLGDVWTSK